MSRKTENEIPYVSHTRGLWILSPLLVFFLLYVTTSVAVGDFYKMPVTVAFMAACTWAFIVCRPRRFSERIERFSRGAAHSNIMMMVWIFVLAGAFAQSAKYIGSVDATVNLTLSLLPANMVLAGVFLAACIISLSIGTSVGTIVALMPVAVGLADKAGAPLALMAGGVIGGPSITGVIIRYSPTFVKRFRTRMNTPAPIPPSTTTPSITHTITALRGCEGGVLAVVEDGVVLSAVAVLSTVAVLSVIVVFSVVRIVSVVSSVCSSRVVTVVPSAEVNAVLFAVVEVLVVVTVPTVGVAVVVVVVLTADVVVRVVVVVTAAVVVVVFFVVVVVVGFAGGVPPFSQIRT